MLWQKNGRLVTTGDDFFTPRMIVDFPTCPCDHPCDRCGCKTLGPTSRFEVVISGVGNMNSGYCEMLNGTYITQPAGTVGGRCSSGFVEIINPNLRKIVSVTFTRLVNPVIGDSLLFQISAQVDSNRNDDNNMIFAGGTILAATYSAPYLCGNLDSERFDLTALTNMNCDFTNAFADVTAI